MGGAKIGICLKAAHMCLLEVENTKDDKEKVKSSCENSDTSNEADTGRVGALTIVPLLKTAQGCFPLLIRVVMGLLVVLSSLWSRAAASEPYFRAEVLSVFTHRTSSATGLHLPHKTRYDFATTIDLLLLVNIIS